MNYLVFSITILSFVFLTPSQNQNSHNNPQHNCFLCENILYSCKKIHIERNRHHFKSTSPLCTTSELLLLKQHCLHMQKRHLKNNINKIKTKTYLQVSFSKMGNTNLKIQKVNLPFVFKRKHIYRSGRTTKSSILCMKIWSYLIVQSPIVPHLQ